MVYVSYDEAVREMAKGLSRFMDEENAKHFAEIFAGNSLDGIYSHGMNRYPRYIGDMESGLCDPKVTKAEKVGGFGALEVYEQGGHRRGILHHDGQLRHHGNQPDSLQARSTAAWLLICRFGSDHKPPCF